MQRKRTMFWRLPFIMDKIISLCVVIMKKFWKGINKHDQATATLLGVAVAIMGLYFGLKQYNDNVKNQTKAATIQYLVGFSDMLTKTDTGLLDTMNFFNNKNKLHECLDKDTLEKILHKNKAYRQQLDNIVIYLNQLAIGCDEGFYDERTAWSANKYRIMNAVNALTPYFKIREKEENLKENDRVCWYLRNMVHRWNKNIGKCKDWSKEGEKEITKTWLETRREEEEIYLKK